MRSLRQAIILGGPKEATAVVRSIDKSKIPIWGNQNEINVWETIFWHRAQYFFG